MENKSVTTITLKKINKAKVYQYIYSEKKTSKQQIVQNLHMGLSTVSQNLSILEQEGLIERSGFFKSTGGRKANSIQIVSDFKISIGVGLQRDLFHIVSVDLYGKILDSCSVSLPYQCSEAYYQQVTDEILSFISRNQYTPKQLLGISFATQGIISPDGASVTYGRIMDNYDMKLSDFSHYLPYPCRLEHDSKAVGYLELWNHPELDSAIVLLLNYNFGGAIITNHSVHQGMNMQSGTIEHMCLDPNGPDCYCGNRGCVETYCSVYALEQMIDMKLQDFFTLIHSDPSNPLQPKWTAYLDHLAAVIQNLNFVIDCPFIISGYLATYFTEKDFEYLYKKVNSVIPFSFSKEKLIPGSHGPYTPAWGTALYYIEQFLHSIQSTDQ